MWVNGVGRMTVHKRFVADNEYVMQNNEVFVFCGGEHSADVISTALNELLEKNVQLKQENYELKKFKNRLYGLVDNLIKRAKNSESSNEYKLGAIQVLQTLEKELEND